MDGARIVCRAAALDDIYRLRFAVLRPGQAVERVHWEGDDAESPRTFHFAAFETGDGGEKVVGCLTLLTSEWEGTKAYQLRGMAVEEGYRSQGVGGRLLKLAMDEVVRQTEVRLLWCYARKGAIAFYERHGWKVMSEEFEIPTAGPHRKMIRVL